MRKSANDFIPCNKEATNSNPVGMVFFLGVEDCVPVDKVQVPERQGCQYDRNRISDEKERGAHWRKLQKTSQKCPCLRTERTISYIYRRLCGNLYPKIDRKLFPGVRRYCSDRSSDGNGNWSLFVYPGWNLCKSNL